MSWIDQFLSSVKDVFSFGVVQPRLPGINFGTGLTVTPNVPAGYNTVTATGSGGAPVAPVAKSTSFNIAAPATNQDFYLTSSSAITATITGVPTDGVRIRFFDNSQNWATYPMVFASQAGGTVRDPKNLAATPTGSASVNLSGACQEWEWSAGASTWFAC